MVNINQKDGNQMSRPDWLVCSNCFFFIVDQENAGDCFLNPTLEYKFPNSFCSNWKCKNCWKEMDSWHWSEEKDKEIYVDHNKCIKVEFE